MLYDPDPDVDVAYSLHIKAWPDWVEAGEEDLEAGLDVHASRMYIYPLTLNWGPICLSVAFSFIHSLPLSQSPNSQKSSLQ